MVHSLNTKVSDVAAESILWPRQWHLQAGRHAKGAWPQHTTMNVLDHNMLLCKVSAWQNDHFQVNQSFDIVNMICLQHLSKVGIKIDIWDPEWVIFIRKSRRVRTLKSKFFRWYTIRTRAVKLRYLRVVKLNIRRTVTWGFLCDVALCVGSFPTVAWNPFCNSRSGGDSL